MSRRLRLVAATALVTATVLAPPALPATAAAAPEIVTVSNRADLVSGGDVLVEVRLPEDSDPASLRVTRNGSDVTGSFATGPDGRLLGLVSGLRDGENELTADLASSPRARLTVTNHPLSGPVFSGPQVRPWLCETHLYGMPPATGPECAAETRHDFFYRSRVTGEFEPFDPASPPDPSVVAETTTDRGVTVPYLVRRERGVLNRGIYDIAVLFDPARPWQDQQAFNGKLHWLFGYNCKPGHRQAGGASNSIGEANGYRPDSDHGPVDVLAKSAAGGPAAVEGLRRGVLVVDACGRQL